MWVHCEVKEVQKVRKTIRVCKSVLRRGGEESKTQGSGTEASWWVKGETRESEVEVVEEEILCDKYTVRARPV